MTKFKYIGKPAVRIEGKEKVSGAAQYTDDIDFGPNLVYAAIVESPYAHAKINGIDTKEAEQLPGVLRVVTGKEFPYRFGLYMHDRFIFAQDRTRFIGEQVAAVIARDPGTAKRGTQLVKVDYTELTPLLDVGHALDKDKEKEKVRMHPELKDYHHVPWFFPQEDT
ncbi:MAG: xanthine dehydrogenase family protein molybdopterin-binding subunit, partial [bacterium]|nr:xanthine dehydrogenase family protein molybdopterin-binding subunit [bacterium]